MPGALSPLAEARSAIPSFRNWTNTNILVDDLNAVPEARTELQRYTVSLALDRAMKARLVAQL
ncbi:hypothetical protein [Bradyrhizobium sp.]|uniref:hypothetical protein n=1 Tax=Bradyrhizobium sp. TaxID=376 RepID=UPI003C64069A